MRKKYFQYKAENLIHVKNIVTVHDFYFDKHFKSEEESHDFWEIVYAESGKILYSWNGVTGELGAGRILFHKPNVTHALQADGEHEAHVIIISFNCKSEALKYFENFTGDLSDKLKKYVFELVENGGRIFDLSSSTPETKKMPEKENPPLGGIQILKNTLELFLIYLLQAETAKSNASAVFLPPRDDEHSLADTVKSLLNNNVYGNLSIEEICDKTYYSRSYLFRKFKKETDVTVMAYYNALKINEAKRLLSSTQFSIAEISALLLFDTPNYFSKQFKKSVGITPLAFRKSK